MVEVADLAVLAAVVLAGVTMTATSRRTAVYNFHRARCLFASNEIFVPTTFVYGWIDKLGSRIGFIKFGRGGRQFLALVN
jgi:hypothetical protein